MADPADNTEVRGAAKKLEDPVSKLDLAVVEAVIQALAAGDAARVGEHVANLHPADVADLLEWLSADERHGLVEVLREMLDPEILSELDDTVREEIIAQLGVQSVAAAVAELDTDDAVNVIEELEEPEQRKILDAMSVGDRTLIEERLAYPEDSAGRLMQHELVTVPSFWSVGETIDYMRKSADLGEVSLPEIFYDIFVVDPMYRPAGTLPLSRLLRTRRPVLVSDLMETEMNLISAHMDQEEVAFLFRQRDLVSAPVVDAGGCLVGAITIDDVVDVIHEEHEEDIMRLGGVQEDDLFSAVVDTTRHRFVWLLVNLATAMMASLVIGLFEATIEQMVALAVLMPIVASMGGNAGTQSLTVAVRALATRELTSTNALRVVGKELFVGAFNGVLFAGLTGLITWAWFASPALGFVIALAMIINLMVAGLAGTTIPLLVERAGIDPAIASSVILTAITDVVGFFVFLSLGAWLLL